ncbi:MAG: amidoligase family protein [Sumerlaeia bacterium]
MTSQATTNAHAAAAALKTFAFGVEIETIGRSATTLARSVATAMGWTQLPGNSQVRDNEGRVWAFVYDASISGTGCEMVTPKLRYDDIETLQNVVRTIRRAGARAHASCGTHIHIDASTLDAGAVGRVAKLFAAKENMIFLAAEATHRMTNRFCAPTSQDFIKKVANKRPKTLSEMSSLWYGEGGRSLSRYHSSRYRALNFHSLFYRGTIEFRLFNSELHAGKIKSYIQLCLGLIAYAKVTTNARFAPTAMEEVTYERTRIFLKNIGFRGEEFETARLHLTRAAKAADERRAAQPAQLAQAA